MLFVVCPGFEALDVAGPASVFWNANRVLKRAAYALTYTSVLGRPVVSSSGLEISTQPLELRRLARTDTVLVAGLSEETLPTALADARLSQWLRTSATTAGRYGAVCAGSLILAAAGLLEGKRVTTHWAGFEQLAALAPGASVEREALYAIDGPLWTSAGVTTGIDMCLEMVRSDHGRTVAGEVARALVVYSHRPGNQSQFSDILERQVSGGEPFDELISWLARSHHLKINVADMAGRCGMTERTFYRRFQRLYGITPSEYLRLLRLDHARSLLEDGMPLKHVHHEVGFESEASFRVAFKQRYGLTPSARANRREARST